MTAVLVRPAPATLAAHRRYVGCLLLIERGQMRDGYCETRVVPLLGPGVTAVVSEPLGLLLPGPGIVRQLDRIPQGSWTAGWLLVDRLAPDGAFWLMPADDEPEDAWTETDDANDWLHRWWAGEDDTFDLGDVLDEFLTPAPRVVSL